MGRAGGFFKSRLRCADCCSVSRTDQAPGGKPWPGEKRGQSVSSRPLRKSVKVRNTWFPKTRSWFALGAPIELLSPLSVIRVVLVFTAVVLPPAALAAGYPFSHRWIVAVVTGVSGLTLISLMRARTVGQKASTLLAGWITVSAVFAVWGAHQSRGAICFLISWAGLAIFDALFSSWKRLLVDTATLGVALWIALGSDRNAISEIAVIASALIAYAGAASALAFAATAARRRDTVDTDTGLPNGYGLAKRLGAGPPRPLVVAVTNLAGLGDARGALGYAVGSELLQRIVENIGQVLPPDAMIGRVDGDEIVVVEVVGPPIGHRGPSLDTATQKASILVDVLSKALSASRYLVGGIELAIRSHTGVAFSPWDGDDLATLIRKASLSAKRAMAENQPVHIWDGDEGAMTAVDLQLLAELRVAINKGELSLAYQPQVSSETGEILAVEALMRWAGAKHGPVSPARFIPLAERTGLVCRLTEWALAEALDAQVRWRKQGIFVPVAVNLSATLLTRGDLAKWILSELHARKLPPSVLTVEITETAEPASISRAAALLSPLRREGVKISLDDFGTGYTSMSVLPTLPLDEIKIDQSFVGRSGTSRADDAIVRSIADLAHRLGFAVVAEGVEDQACADRLREHGVQILQGFFFHRPLSEAALVEAAKQSEVERTGST